jgi:hypothetical protein
MILNLKVMFDLHFPWPDYREEDEANKQGFVEIFRFL